MGDRIMRRLLASLTVASLLVAVACSPSPTAPVAKLNPKVSLDCSNGNNGNNPPNTAGGGCGGSGTTQNSSNNPPTTAQH
jgi:hypothetical protein